MNYLATVSSHHSRTQGQSWSITLSIIGSQSFSNGMGVSRQTAGKTWFVSHSSYWSLREQRVL